MTRPPNAIRCPCGRGGLRAHPHDGSLWCDHSARIVSNCRVAVNNRRRDGRPAPRSSRRKVTLVTVVLVRTWPYATEDEP